LTSLIFKSGLNIFESSNDKQAVVKPPTYDVNTQKYYIEIKIRHKDENYSVNERSLGFKWYFTFLLLTQFRVKRQNSISPIFLFDEPASNLHSEAQKKIRVAFEKLTENSDTKVIFTTHSHHLIDVRWLENCFIVDNLGIKNPDDENYTAFSTDIKISRYRTFVSINPSKTTYFQPILDKLKVVPSDFDYISPICFFEGKTDFYFFKWASELLNVNIPVAPATSSSAMDAIICLYSAWNRPFIIILDDDKEGKKQKERYLEEYGVILSEKVFTFSDIDSSWSNLALEKLIDKTERESIQNIKFPSSEYDKKSYHFAVQELFQTKNEFKFADKTIEIITRICKFINEKLDQDTENS
jgi:energy-coupling factor transporter ATP-binding protein EcfA2